MWLRNTGRNLLALLIGLLVSVVLLEGLLRIFQPIEYRVKANKIKLPRDKKYQFRNDETDKLDRIIYSSRNHQGFRGEPLPSNFAGSLTVIAIGGSTTECLLISDGKAWCDLLARKLTARFKPVWLGNGGLDGMSTYGHITFLEDYIIRLKPKVALFLVGANDISLVEGQRTDDSKFFRKSITGVLASAWEGLLNHSEVLDYATNFYRYYKAKRMGLIHRIFDFPRLPQLEIPPEQEQAILKEHQEKFLQPYARRLTKLISLCRDNHIKPVFITQPVVFGDLIDPLTGADLAKAQSYGYNGRVLWEVLELYNGVVRDAGRRQQVFVIDLAREMPKSTEYFYDTYHFSNAGSRRVAEIVYRQLEPLLEKHFPQFTVSK
ncbi:MAG: SGNH/GDSL hydrolase family protein [Deltaproteobacteria bacterium]|nr:SGNH/GDSL hydrolase family protein [Deltaproteobacteria bacterium]